MTMTKDLSGTSNEVLEHECQTLAAQIAAATCRFLLVIGELDVREAWGHWWGLKSMAHWLSWRCSLSQQAAYEHVRVARALRELPLTVEAFERGELSYSKVRAITRVATAEGEAELVELARTATAAQLEKIIRAAVVAMTDPDKHEELRELYTGSTGEGMGELRSRMRIDELAIVDAAIAAALPDREDSSAEESPIARRRVDALIRICESYLVNGDGARNPPARNNAVVHVDIDRSGVVTAVTEGGVPLPREVAQRLLCDSSVQGMLGEMGLPIGVGRTTQAINRKLRRALHKRSGGGCEWKGCTERHYVEAHHVWHWVDGGPTELWNLVNLCWHHHHLVHKRGWRLEHDGRGGVRCYRPDGSELLDPIPTWAPPLDIELAKESIVPLWAGERFDLSACVDAVLAARSG
jgi:hypothetical protein